jgi:hypothetical protein
MNGLRGLEPFRVYGILSDSITFEFFGYDGGKFYRDLPMILSNETVRGTPPDYYLDAMGKGELLNHPLEHF